MYTIVFADDEEEVRQAIIKKVNWEEIGYKFVGAFCIRYRTG